MTVARRSAKSGSPTWRRPRRQDGTASPGSVANESDEPVFKVEVVSGIATEEGTIRLGPLSAPRIIPVLPPNRESVYDVTMGMLSFGYFAHDAFRGLVAEVCFRVKLIALEVCGV